jgi:hypothetical protein
MDWRPSPEGVRDNLWSSAIGALTAIVVPTVLTAWAWISERLSPPLLVTLAIANYGIVVWAISRTWILFRLSAASNEGDALRKKVAELEAQLKHEHDAVPGRRREQKILASLVERGVKILNLYKLPRVTAPTKDLEDRKILEELQVLGDLHRQWEGEVKTQLCNFFDKSYVVRFIDSNEPVIYPGVEAGVVEERQQAFLTLYSQVLQLKKFHEETEKNSETESLSN